MLTGICTERNLAFRVFVVQIPILLPRKMQYYFLSVKFGLRLVFLRFGLGL